MKEKEREQSEAPMAEEKLWEGTGCAMETFNDFSFFNEFTAGASLLSTCGVTRSVLDPGEKAGGPSSIFREIPTSPWSRFFSWRR